MKSKTYRQRVLLPQRRWRVENAKRIDQLIESQADYSTRLKILRSC